MQHADGPHVHAAITEALASIRHVREYHDAERLPQSLLCALREMLPHIEPAQWPERLRSGAVYVNGTRATAECGLPLPCRVEYFEPKGKAPDMSQDFAPFKTDYIIYEDSDLLVVFKPPALPCLPTRDQQRWNLRAALEEYLGFPPHMPSRLDTSASGVVVTSKHPRSHRAVQHAFQFGAVKKEYLVEVRTPVTFEEHVVDAPIGRSPEHPILRAVRGDGLPSLTTFRRLAATESGTLLLATPRTGRTHQIRVHAQHLGIPLIGDRFYRGAQSEQLHLLSFRMELFHPRFQRTVAFSVPRRLSPPWVARLELPLYNRAAVSFT